MTEDLEVLGRALARTTLELERNVLALETEVKRQVAEGATKRELHVRLRSCGLTDYEVGMLLRHCTDYRPLEVALLAAFAVLGLVAVLVLLTV